MGIKLWSCAEDPGLFLFQCPGCNMGHHVRAAPPPNPNYVYNGPIWDFNNDMVRPTFHPSILTGLPDDSGVRFSKKRCHSFIKDGQIQFLDDCFHELRGRTVELPDIDDAQEDEGDLNVDLIS